MMGGPAEFTSSTRAVGVTGRPGGPPDLRIRSRRVARGLAWAMAVFIAAASVSWAVTAWRILDPCERVAGGDAGCTAPPAALHVVQAVLTVPGLVAAAVVVTFLVSIGATGRTWRRWREVATVFGVLVLAWLVVFAIGAIWIA